MLEGYQLFPVYVLFNPCIRKLWVTVYLSDYALNIQFRRCTENPKHRSGNVVAGASELEIIRYCYPSNALQASARNRPLD